MGPQAHQQPQSALPSLHPQHTGLGAASKLHPGLCLSSAACRLVPSPLPCCSQLLRLSLTWGLMCHLAFALWLLGGQQNRLLSPAQLRVAVPSMVGLCSCWRDHCPAQAGVVFLCGRKPLLQLADTTCLGNHCNSRFKKEKDQPPRKPKPVKIRKEQDLQCLPRQDSTRRYSIRAHRQKNKQTVCSRKKRTQLKLSSRFQCENKEDISEH